MLEGSGWCEVGLDRIPHPVFLPVSRLQSAPLAGGGCHQGPLDQPPLASQAPLAALTTVFSPWPGYGAFPWCVQRKESLFSKTTQIFLPNIHPLDLP